MKGKGREVTGLAWFCPRQALDNAAASLIEQQKLEVLCVTWNVNEQKPDGRSPFFGVVSRLAAPDNVQVVVFGLQEIEMGGGSVAMAAAKDALHKKAQVWSARRVHAPSAAPRWPWCAPFAATQRSSAAPCGSNSAGVADALSTCLCMTPSVRCVHWSCWKPTAATTGSHCPWGVATSCSRWLMQEKGNTNGQWWATQLLLALGGPKLWHHCGLRQLSGMLVVVFARTELEVSTQHHVCAPDKQRAPSRGRPGLQAHLQETNASTDPRHLVTGCILVVKSVCRLARHIGHSARGLLPLTQGLWSPGQDWGGEHLQRGLRGPGCRRQQGRGGRQLHALPAADCLRLLPLCCPPGEVHACWRCDLIILTTSTLQACVGLWRPARLPDTWVAAEMRTGRIAVNTPCAQRCVTILWPPYSRKDLDTPHSRQRLVDSPAKCWDAPELRRVSSIHAFMKNEKTEMTEIERYGCEAQP